MEQGGSGERRHLAGLLVHVEGADDALSDLAARALHQVLGQAVGQVGSPGARIGALLQSFPKMGSRSSFTPTCRFPNTT